MFQETKNINKVPGSSLISGWIAMAPSTNSSLSATTDSLEAQASDLQNPLFTFNLFSTKHQKQFFMVIETLYDAKQVPLNRLFK